MLIEGSAEDDKSRRACGIGYEDLLVAADEFHSTLRRRRADAVNIYYTSGTTGHQKGVDADPPQRLQPRAGAVPSWAGESDVWAHVAPMFHLADAWAVGL